MEMRESNLTPAPLFHCILGEVILCTEEVVSSVSALEYHRSE